MDVDPIRAVTAEERAVAVSMLRRAADKGRLTPSELHLRVGAALQAQLAGDLANALAGIDHYPFDAPSIQWPLLAPSASAVLPQSRTRQRSPTSGYRPEDPLTVSGGLQSQRIRGDWIVPPFLRLHAGLSSVKLDCRCAHAAASTIDIEILAGMTTIVLVLPTGWAADAGAVRRDLGTLRIKVSRLADSGCPTVVLHGRLGITALVVRGESQIDRWLHPVERP